jgi:hypothetical protein
MKYENLGSDDLWEAVKPFVSKEPLRPKGGRLRGWQVSGV